MAGHVEPRHRAKIHVLRLEPERAAGAFDEVGERLDALLLHARHRALRRQRAGEAKPFFAVVVAIGKEMLADEYLELRAEPARRDCQRRRAATREQQLDLQRPAPVAAEVANEIAGAGDREQECARNEQRSRVEHDAARQVHVDRPAGVPRGRDRDERNDQQVGGPARDPEVGVGTPHRASRRRRGQGRTQRCPASPTHSGLMLQRASGGARRSSCSMRIRPTTARPSRSAELDGARVHDRRSRPRDSRSQRARLRPARRRRCAVATAGSQRRAAESPRGASSRRLARNANQVAYRSASKTFAASQTT